MKHSFILSLGCLYFLTPSYIHCDTDQDFQTQLSMLQQTMNIIISQSNLDPAVAQDLTDKTNILTQLAQGNIQKDVKDIHVATGLSSFLETGDALLQTMNVIVPDSFAANLKYSARVNTIQKMLMGAYKGDYSNEPDYTDPYTETIGFTLNDWLLNGLFQVLSNTSLATSLANALNIPPLNPAMQSLITHTAAGITAYCAWTLEKRLFIMPVKKRNQKKQFA
jgi:hypothetical protein